MAHHLLNIIGLRRLVHAVFALLLLPVTLSAQDEEPPTFIDIGLFPKPGDSTTLQVKVRAQDNFNQVVSSLTFTIRWETSSGASLGTIAQFLGPFGPGWCPGLVLPLSKSPDGEIDDGGFRYQTINAFSLNALSGCNFSPGYLWPAGVEVVVAEIPILNAPTCVNFNIVNDAFTLANNKNFFFSLNGIQDCQGVIYSPQYQIGNCPWYSRATGSSTDPIWSITSNGPPGPAIFENDRDVIMQTGHTVTLQGDLLAKDLTVQSGATLNMGSDRLLTASGLLVDIQGTVVPGTGELRLTGQAATNLSLGASIQFHDLTVDVPAGVTLTGGLNIRGTLQLTRGTFNATGGTVRLRSLANGLTGRLGPVGAQAAFNGQLTMERYIPGGVTNWRLLSSPLQGRTVADWDDDFITAGFPGSDYPNFDSPVGSGILWPSVRWYNEAATGPSANDGLLGVPSITDPLVPGKGFAVWCGDALGGTSPFLIDLTGVPVVAQSPLSLSMSYTATGSATADGWNLVGNPLPSPIDFAAVQLGPDVLEQYQIYDPVSGNNAAWNGVVGTNGANGIIQSSQAFWLRANGPEVITSVTEASKVEGNTGGLFGGTPQLGAGLPMVRLTLSSAINGYSDESVVVLQDGAPAFEPSDVAQFVFAYASAPQLATRSSDGRALSINMHGPVGEGLSIPVLVDVAVTGTYTLSASDMEGIVGPTCLVLEDLVTGARTPLSNGATYSFSISASAPADQPRFIIRTSSTSAPVAQNVSCAGGADGRFSIAVDAGPATIAWSTAEGGAIGQVQAAAGNTAVQGLAAGTYTVSVSSGEQCVQLVATVEISAPEVLEGSLFQQQEASCPDSQDAMLQVAMAGGAAPYAFTWSDGTVGATWTGGAGAVELLVADANGCQWTGAWEVGSGEAPLAAIEAPSMVLTNEPVTLQAGPTVADQYLWSFGDGNSAQGALVDHVYDLPGTYVITLVVSRGGCTDTASVQLSVEQTTGMGRQALSPLGAWYAGDRFLISSGRPCEGTLRVDLLDATGRMHQRATLPCSEGVLTLPAADLASGVWFLNIHDARGTRTVRVPVVR